MMLLSLETEGFIYFEGVLDNIAEEIAMALDEQIEDVQMTLSYFTKKGLRACPHKENYKAVRGQNCRYG